MREEGDVIARLRVRSSIQKRGTQERPWIYVDVSPEVSEKEKGPGEGQMGEGGQGVGGATEGRQGADGGEKYL